MQSLLNCSASLRSHSPMILTTKKIVKYPQKLTTNRKQQPHNNQQRNQQFNLGNAM